MTEKGITSGTCQAIYRYAKANYNKNIESSFIENLVANNLNG